MSVESPPEPVAPVLRREALLPNERSRGLGTVAVVCTMAGVASGLALATTLMAMQVADSMSVRTCPYHVVSMPEVQTVDVRTEHGFLGITYVPHDGYADVYSVLPRTPATEVALQPGDHVVAIDGVPLRTPTDLQEQIYGSHPGAHPTLVIERNGVTLTVQPTLVALPPITY